VFVRCLSKAATGLFEFCTRTLEGTIFWILNYGDEMPALGTAVMSDTSQQSILSPEPKLPSRQCPKCSGTMKWFSSQITSGFIIEDRFACDQCGFLEDRSRSRYA
jgi:predicted RNA-binding Zn-ribbon protein involved in translation (DUF1610 family)